MVKFSARILSVIALTLSSLSLAAPWRVVESFPHPTFAFTQGLNFHQGFVYETTGQYGESQLLRYQLGDQQPEILHRLHRRYFGEGSVILNDEVVWLTWQRGVAFAINPETGNRRIAFNYDGEGWGLAISPDQTQMVMSNGSDELQFLTTTGELIREVRVSGGARRWDQLNELEWVGDTIFANRWHTQQLIAIDATTGRIRAVYNFDELWRTQAERQRINRNMSFNGIAYKADSNTFLVTGKYWNTIYEVELEGWQ